MDQNKFNIELKGIRIMVSSLRRGNKTAIKKFLNTLYVFQEMTDLSIKKAYEVFDGEEDQLRQIVNEYLNGLHLVKKSRYPTSPPMKKIEQFLNELHRGLSNV